MFDGTELKNKQAVVEKCIYISFPEKSSGLMRHLIIDKADCVLRHHEEVRKIYLDEYG